MHLRDSLNNITYQVGNADQVLMVDQKAFDTAKSIMSNLFKKEGYDGRVDIGNKKIPIIKTVREITGVGLAEAKYAVEAADLFFNPR